MSKTKNKVRRGLVARPDELPDGTCSYEDHEICLVWRVATTDANALALAALLGRTPGAIQWLWRFCAVVEEQGLDGIGPHASKLLYSQIYLWGINRLGRKERGRILRLEAAFLSQRRTNA